MLAEYTNDAWETKPVWIFGKYAELLTAKDYDDIIEARELMAEQAARQAEQRGEELIEFVRNRMYYRDFSSELGYGPVGKQLDKFFSKGSWGIGTSGNKIFEKQCAFFKGVGHNWMTNRRYMYTVFFNRVAVNDSRFKKGSVIISQINQNDKRVYYYRNKQAINDALPGEAFSELRDYFGMIADFTGVQTNELSLDEFLETIYREGF